MYHILHSLSSCINIASAGLGNQIISRVLRFETFLSSNLRIEHYTFCKEMGTEIQRGDSINSQANKTTD